VLKNDFMGKVTCSAEEFDKKFDIPFIKGTLEFERKEVPKPEAIKHFKEGGRILIEYIDGSTKLLFIDLYSKDATKENIEREAAKFDGLIENKNIFNKNIQIKKFYIYAVKSEAKTMLKNKELILKFYPLWEKFNCYCYGTGEMPILKSLKDAFSTFKNEKTYYVYDVEQIKEKLESEALTYSLIILMDHANFISWGTSIRHGWTEDKGTEFVKLILENDIKELYDAALIDLDTMMDLGLTE